LAGGAAGPARQGAARGRAFGGRLICARPQHHGGGPAMKLFAFVLKNLRRSPLRTFLTSIALVVLVVLFSVIWSILAFLQEAMAQKAADIPVVITERYRIPSRFDRAFMEEIVRPGTRTNTALSEIQGFHSEKHNVWHFIVFSVDNELKNIDEQLFVI